MKHGVIAETPSDKLQNKLRGVGSLMLRENFPKYKRVNMARAIYDALSDYGEIRRNLVFAAFFTKGELSEDDTFIRVREARAQGSPEEKIR